MLDLWYSPIYTNAIASEARFPRNRYRLVHEGRILKGNFEALSVAHRAVSEDYIHDGQLPEHIVDWISTEED